MELKSKFMLVMLAPTLLVGCTLPGSHLSENSENVVTIIEANQKADISQVINLYTLSAKTVATYGGMTHFSSKANAELDQQIAQYEYRVGAGDILNVTIWDHPELTIPAGSYRSASEAGNWVHADGTIFYPYIGVVKVAGKTVREIRADIADRLAKYIESPQVDVNVAAFRSKKLT